MIRSKKFINEASREQSFSRRAILIAAGQVAIGVVLATRMAYISIIDNDQYKWKSDDNRIDMILIPPRRGWILDRNGKAIANNRVSLRIDLISDRLQNPDAIIAQLEVLLSLDHETLQRIRRDLKQASGSRIVSVAGNLDEARYLAVSVRLPELPGVATSRGYARNYPTGAAVGHLIGYVGTPTVDEYETVRDPLYFTPGFTTGKNGLEKYFEADLRGKPGIKRLEVTARGKVVRALGVQPDIPGKQVHLTIDSELQIFAARRMGLESGAVVVIDCLTGDILAFVSMPCFDPNSFSGGIGQQEWAMLRADDHEPLINKATRGLYPPGSTLKPVAALAALEAGVSPDEKFTCRGGYQLGRRFFRCLGTHGAIDMTTAIKRSCNSYFYALGHRLGYDRIAAFARKLSLGETYDLAGSNQRFGTIPDSKWKIKRFGKAWTGSDSLNAVIGQGYVLANPLQLAVMTARIASGKTIVPRLTVPTQSLASLVPSFSAPSALECNPTHLALVRSAMDRVVNDSGTAARSRLPIKTIRMAGKTGTAQVLRRGAQELGNPWQYRDHGLFICFAPVEEPRYAAAVVIEHGGGGSRAAAPVAKDIFTWLYDKDKALTSLAALEEGWGGSIKERMDYDFAQWLAGTHRAQTQET